MKRFPHGATLADRLLALARPGIGILEWLPLIIIIVGARLWLVANYGGATPIYDQWDGEAAFLFKPWLEGTLQWADLFSLHNEHRIVLARVLSLGLLQLNGQWDPLLEIAVNTLFCGLIALAAAFGLRRVFTEANRSLIFAAVIFWLALPYAHENTLWGFQSSFYFLLLFSLMAIWGLGLQRGFSVPWCFGAFGAILACLTVFSGFFAASAALGMVGLRSIKQRRMHRENVATVIVICVITAVACYFRPGSPHWHEHLKASSVLGWLAVFRRCLAWPFPNYAAVALIMYLPLGLLARLFGKWFHRRESEIVAANGTASGTRDVGDSAIRRDRLWARRRWQHRNRLSLHGHPGPRSTRQFRRSHGFSQPTSVE